MNALLISFLVGLILLFGNSVSLDKNIVKKEGSGLATNTETVDVRALKAEVEDQKRILKVQKDSIPEQQKIVDDLIKQKAEEPDESKKKEIQGHIDFQQKGLDNAIKNIALLEQQIIDLESQIAELEKQQ